MTLAGSATRLDDALAAVAGERARWNVPGLELTVVADGSGVFAGGFGVCGVDDPTPVTATTLFHHGSCGKAYTGLLATLLAAEGVLDLDAPVRRHVPELQLPDPVIAERVTIRDLLSHRSGLGRHDLAWIFNGSWSRAEAVARMAHLPLVGDLRAQWSYSNFGYTLAGEAIGRATGSSWEEQLRLCILEPLGMTRSAPDQAGLRGGADAARPHVVRDGVALRTVYRDLAATAPSGELVSCAEDSVRWLLAQLGKGAVAADAVQVTHDPQMLLPRDSSPLPEWDLLAYGFGWISGRFRNRRLVWHNGGVDGFTTYTLLLPDDGIGVLAAANVFPSAFPLAVVLSVADALTGEESAWFDRLRPPDTTVPVAAIPQPTRPLSARPLPAYLGTFRHPGYGDLVVALEGEQVTVRLGDGSLSVTDRTDDVWQVRYEPLDTDLTVTFAPDAGVSSAVVTQDDDDTPLEFRRVEDAT